MKHANYLFLFTAIISLFALLYGLILNDSDYIRGGILFLGGPIGFLIGLFFRKSKFKFTIKRNKKQLILFIVLLIGSSILIFLIKTSSFQPLYKVIINFTLVVLVIFSGFFMLAEKTNPQ